jgi:hypothetical protein
MGFQTRKWNGAEQAGIQARRMSVASKPISLQVKII